MYIDLIIEVSIKGGSSMDTYESMVQLVLNYLSDHQYSSKVIKMNKLIFEKLRLYLEERDVTYSPKLAYEWYTGSNNLTFSDLQLGRLALKRLEDVFETGSIRIKHDTRHLLSYTILSSSMKACLCKYLDFLKGSLSERTINNHLHSCAKFLAFAQKKGAHNIKEINISHIIDFYSDTSLFSSNYSKSQVNCNVSSMLKYFYDLNEVSYGCTVVLHYLNDGKNQECFLNKLSIDANLKIYEHLSQSNTVSIETLIEYKKIIIKLLRDNDYSKSVISICNRAIDFLILFLEINGYKYSHDIAMIWFEEVVNYVEKQKNSYRRALCMLGEYHNTSSISLETIHRAKPSKFYKLPKWCLEPGLAYVETKKKEGWERSTLDMIRSSIARFCFFLDAEGLCSFKDLTAYHIKKFHACDQHKTPQGKNAYNIRIRKFLMYLGEHGYLSNPMLFVAITRQSAPRDSIVVVLTDDEIEKLNRQLKEENSILSFRKKAMLSLGLKMGLRASDVVNLSIDDINWNCQSIKFIQKKTLVEVNLPMPTEVGNALFRYITEERGQKASSKVFLSENAPKKPIGRGACIKALNKALPERKVKGSGFHVTRKTYATQLLKNGVGANMVSEALGQRGTSSVHRYLSLDVDRMRMCPLSLLECGIKGWSYE